ncbi:substrate-binding domain-containing protein [Bdellovibrio bacteriovorus]|uniref:substrate-binding domain-containing protein n=1 Tax=Bdellovibrio bacteriovorus TaxID=959 RepID=UPI003D020A9E
MLSSFKHLFLTALLWLLPLSLGQASALEVPVWSGPASGPKAQEGRRIIFIASDLKNGGAAAVSEGFLSAGRMLKWNITIRDGQGSRAKIQKALNEAIQAGSDGIVLGGFDAADFRAEIKKAQSAHIKIVGWHSAPRPGSSSLMFSNVTTDPLTVAEKAARLVCEGSEKSGVVIFTDNDFSIARAKTLHMKKYIDEHKNCNVLEIMDVQISKAEHLMPGAVARLNERFGKKWTHSLAINDIYFDHINFPLKNIGRKDLINVSAGDGSATALHRIKSGLSQQVATIAEPLKAQGWQVADELNRAFAGSGESGYTTEPLVITQEVLKNLKDGNLESKLNYKEAYSKIWYP